MKAVVHVGGGPLDGLYNYENYRPDNLNNTGLAQTSNGFLLGSYWTERSALAMEKLDTCNVA